MSDDLLTQSFWRAEVGNTMVVVCSQLRRLKSSARKLSRQLAV